MATTSDDGEARRRYPVRKRKVVKNDYIAKLANKSKSWKTKETNALLSNLKRYGDRDVTLLSSKVETKAPNVVHSYLQKHKDFVDVRSTALNMKPDKTYRHQLLNQWIEYMKEKNHKYPLPNPVALSVLMVSLMEDHPVSTDGEVNFPEAYQYMFELLSGRYTSRLDSSEKVSAPTLKFIKLTVLGLLKDVKKNMDMLHSKFIQAANNDGPTLEVPVPDHVQSLLSLEYYNPLNLNEHAVSADSSWSGNRTKTSASDCLSK